MKTLALRVEQQNVSALAMAERLERHPRVRRVWYPGLVSHPNHETAKHLMSGFGGVVTFEIDGDLQDTSRVIDACRIPRIAPSLGGVESLIEQPALMSYFELSTEEREAIGIKNNLVRYAVGIEDTDELIADVLNALDSTGQRWNSFLPLRCLPAQAVDKGCKCAKSLLTRLGAWIYWAPNGERIDDEVGAHRRCSPADEDHQKPS
jgi:hypothetical protein